MTFQVDKDYINGSQILNKIQGMDMWQSDLLFWAHDAGILRCEQVQDGIQEAQIKLQIHLLNQHFEVPEVDRHSHNHLGAKLRKPLMQALHVSMWLKKESISNIIG